jgi:hypothetical protein
MKLDPKTKTSLEQKFRKVTQTSASFAFFEAIHDFIGCIELAPALSKKISRHSKMVPDLNTPAKYGYLRQIYQGIEDTKTKKSGDLGHERYSAIRDLGRIRNLELSENNFFWKKRELFRKVAGEVYLRLVEEDIEQVTQV